ncbi:MAG: hypothetical protein M5U28_42050 [Sandaracinaceae bacterium]|nr:hypothetical protein [Sandaracinaceae bacterium]
MARRALALSRRVQPELDTLYLRYYASYDPTFDVSGSSHNGAGISAHYYVDGRATPGIPADGTNKFLIELEAWRGEPSEPSPRLAQRLRLPPAAAPGPAALASTSPLASRGEVERDGV